MKILSIGCRLHLYSRLLLTWSPTILIARELGYAFIYQLKIIRLFSGIFPLKRPGQVCGFPSLLLISVYQNLLQEKGLYPKQTRWNNTGVSRWRTGSIITGFPCTVFSTCSQNSVFFYNPIGWKIPWQPMIKRSPRSIRVLQNNEKKRR